MHVDTEGHDWKILSQLDLPALAPRIILYEHKHLARVDKEASFRFLAGRYDLYDFGQDIMAVRKDDNQSVRSGLWVIRGRKVPGFSDNRGGEQR